jgi:polysaccharide biosynthesis/export protein
MPEEAPNDMTVPRFSAVLCPAIAAALVASFAAFGCGPATAGDNGGLPAVPAASAASAIVDYRIGPLDTLSVTVFQVKDLTIDKLQVDAGGQILLPLIGSVTAAGKTTSELSADIARRLGEHYMQSPQVSVVVEEAVSQKVSVEGAVTEAGVFEMKGRTSLLEAVAMAKGPTKDADLRRVALIRSVDGVPHAATFDYQAIEEGRAGDPEIVGNDIVVVADSKSKEFWHGAISWLPALWVLTLIH